MDVPVVIVGGGPVGLCASIALSRFGVRSLLVERHPATSTFPKGRALSIRTMEVLRRYGLEQQVLAAGLPREQSLHFFFGTSLTCAGYTRNSTLPDPGRAAASPAFTAVCSQDVLEPLLRRHAESLAPSEIRFGCRVTALTPDAEGVTVHLEGQRALRAGYVIGADGADSFVRDVLGVGMSGEPDLGENLNILFEADLRPYVADRLSMVYSIANEALTGTFMAVDNRRRWLLNVVRPPVYRSAGDLIRCAAGVPGLDLKVIATRRWTAAALLADVYRAGRVFLAGDAAHPMTPYGGFGMNCGIQDADNLAWKIAAVLRGRAGPGVLDSYQAERRPVGAATVAESHRSLLAALGPAHARPRGRPSDGLVLGYAYDGDGAAIVADGSPPPDRSDPVAVYRPSARPGHRVPHLWVRRGVSALDLVGTGFALLTGTGGSSWDRAVRHAAQGAQVTVHQVGPQAAEAYGIEPEGAVLVRPDDHVAWRCPQPPGRRGEVLSDVLDAVLSRRTEGWRR